jgi:hypothetical protein
MEIITDEATKMWKRIVDYKECNPIIFGSHNPERESHRYVMSNNVVDIIEANKAEIVSGSFESEFRNIGKHAGEKVFKQEWLCEFVDNKPPCNCGCINAPYHKIKLGMISYLVCGDCYKKMKEQIESEKTAHISLDDERIG